MTEFAKKTFSAASYATFRPSYPQSLYRTVLAYHRGPRKLAIDFGCGHGVATRELSSSFDAMIGTDPSKNMIEQASNSTPKEKYPHTTFHQAAAENTPFVEAGSVDMVTAAQASHWFDQPRLFSELNRIMRKGGTMAFWGYKDHVFVDYPKATKIMDHYTYANDDELMGPYWEHGRYIVRDKLRAIKPPEEDWEDIQRIEYEPGTKGKNSGEGTLFLERRMKVGECKEYIRTWSAYHAWREAQAGMEAQSRGGKGDVVDQMFEEIAKSDPELSDMDKEVDMEWGSALILARKR